jgi:hypothetical protein
MRSDSTHSEDEVLKALDAFKDNPACWPVCLKGLQIDAEKGQGVRVVLWVSNLDHCPVAQIHAVFCFEKNIRRCIEAANSAWTPRFALMAA